MKRLALLFALLLALPLAAATTVTGTITTNTTWTTAGAPYYLSGLVQVGGPNAPVLTIEPGTIVRGTAGSLLTVNVVGPGALVVRGDPGEPVIFTGGDGTPGFWQGVQIGNVAGAPQSSITNAKFEFAGRTTAPERGGLTVGVGGDLVIQNVVFHRNVYGLVAASGTSDLRNCSIKDSQSGGIRVSAPATLRLTGTAILNNNGYAVSLQPGATIASGAAVTASGNGSGRDSVEIRGGTFSANGTLPVVAGLPYVVTGSVEVAGAASPVLTIAPGATLKFAAGADLACNVTGKGAVRAIGTAKEPILFTSNGIDTPVLWLGLRFGPVSGGPQSALAHATVEYAGPAASPRGAITVDANAATFDHLTVRHAAGAGIRLLNGPASISNSTIVSNGGAGIYAENGTVLTLAGNTFSSNAGYAVSLPASVSIASAATNTASNNAGGDAIEYRAGAIAAHMTWPVTGMPYAVSGAIHVGSASAPILTIAAGNLVRFNAGAELSCNQSGKGAIRAPGQAGAPIVFTTNGAQTPGFWRGLLFGAQAAAPQSQLSFATVEYGGVDAASRGGITVQGGSPQFEHLILRNNLFSGLTAENSTPRISNARFSDNPRGVHTIGATTAVDARLNYWSAAAGPCLLPAACASGQQSVTAAVHYGPWLLTVPVTPLFLTSAVPSNGTFNPEINTRTTIDYETSLPGTVAVTIRNAASAVVRSLTVTEPQTIIWDGTNDAGTVQPDGVYRYDIALTAASQPPAAVARGQAVIDSTRFPVVTGFAWDRQFFSPNGDAVLERTKIDARVNYDEVGWVIKIVNTQNGATVRTVDGTGPAIFFEWDGTGDGSLPAADGPYSARLTYSVGNARLLAEAATTLDRIPPAVNITAPAADQVLSNIYANGNTQVGVTGAATDTNLQNWSLHAGRGSPPTIWSSLGQGAAPVSGTLATWLTETAPNAPYTLLLEAADKAGNTAQQAVEVTLGNFKATQSAYEFNASQGQTIAYTSAVPFAVSQSVLIRNVDNVPVRTILSGVPRAAGTFVDAFNGRDDQGALLPDGPYFYEMTLTAGRHTFTWNLRNVMRTEPPITDDALEIGAYDPFDNRPLTFQYEFARAGRVSVATSTSPDGGSIIGDCQVPGPTFSCPMNEVWQESGPHTFTWWGLDHTGAYRPIHNLGIINETHKFPRNAAVLFGSKPQVKNVRVSPAIFGPEFETQVIELDLTTYENRPANISVAITNLETLSTLRTLTLPAQSPGHVVLSWNGRAYDGKYVAPGRYAVVVTATDAPGSAAQSGILTTVQY